MLNFFKRLFSRRNSEPKSEYSGLTDRWTQETIERELHLGYNRDQSSDGLPFFLEGGPILPEDSNNDKISPDGQ